MNFRGTIIAPAYDAVIRNALIEQVIVGVLAALVLDGGMMAKVVGVAVLGFWICVARLLLDGRTVLRNSISLLFVGASGRCLGFVQCDR